MLFYRTTDLFKTLFNLSLSFKQIFRSDLNLIKLFTFTNPVVLKTYILLL